MIRRQPPWLAGAFVAVVTSVAWAQAPPPAQAPTTPQVTPMEEARRIQAADVDKYLTEGKVLLLDVREAKELEELGTIEGAVHIPVGEIEKRMGELPKDRLILTA
jgi:rhodanese-related sulfurtransferase